MGVGVGVGGLCRTRLSCCVVLCGAVVPSPAASRHVTTRPLVAFECLLVVT